MTTVVTAYYPLEKAKHGQDQYACWLQNFCKIPCNLVVFTDESMAGSIRQWREGHGKTTLMVRPLDSFRMSGSAMMALWNRQHALDPEKEIHSPKLYAIWALKQEWVRLAIGMNPYHSGKFVWCDMGILRDPGMQSYYENFPNRCADLCPRGRMLMMEVEPIPESFVQDWRAHRPMKEPVPANHIGGGCLAGDQPAWEDFGQAVEKTIAERDARGRFVGKDQTVYFAIHMGRKTKTPPRLIWPAPFAGGRGDLWMSFPVILAGTAPAVVDPRFENGFFSRFGPKILRALGAATR